MAIKKIITEPNKLLRKISLPVENVGKKEQQLMDDMLDTMYAANGIGLAAIQIGVPKRIIVMDISKNPENKELNNSIPYRIVNIGNNTSVNLMDFIEILEDELDKKAKKIFMKLSLCVYPEF